MVSECKNYLEWMPRALAGDLSAEEQQRLDLHLAACSCCRAEQQRYANTVEMLRSLDDEPAPRHFFVYPPERASSPWQIVRQLSPAWRLATAGVFAAFLFLSITAFSGVRIQSGRGTWEFSFGRSAPAAAVDVAALKADILNAAEERNRANSRVWIRDLRAELASRNGLSEQQQIQIAEALSSLENRLNGRMTSTADEIRAGAGKANVGLYQAVSLQRQQDLSHINNRLDGIVEANETKFRQTDEILETLLQIVTNLKQPGEQK